MLINFSVIISASKKISVAFTNLGHANWAKFGLLKHGYLNISYVVPSNSDLLKLWKKVAYY